MGKSFRRERTDWGQRGREQRRERQQQPRGAATDDQDWDDMEPLFPWGVDQPEQQAEQEHA